MERNKLGMACFLFGEANFFLALILAYVFYEVKLGIGHVAARHLDIAATSIYTACLLASSATVSLADRSERHGRHRPCVAWLAVTIALGLAFLVGQAREYAGLLAAHVTPAASVFGAAFFTLTGLHGLHVLLGTLALSVVLLLGAAGRVGRAPSPAIGCVALYWHFVDWVWVAIFGVVYVAAFV